MGCVPNALPPILSTKPPPSPNGCIDRYMHWIDIHACQAASAAVAMARQTNCGFGPSHLSNPIIAVDTTCKIRPGCSSKAAYRQS